MKELRRIVARVTDATRARKTNRRAWRAARARKAYRFAVTASR